MVRPQISDGLMISFMVLDQSNYADGLVWTNSPNGPEVDFEHDRGVFSSKRRYF